MLPGSGQPNQPAATDYYAVHRTAPDYATPDHAAIHRTAPNAVATTDAATGYRTTTDGDSE